jgi:hypothetical protein
VKDDIKFIVMADVELSEDRPDTYVAASPRDTRDLLDWLSYPREEFGYVEAADLRARCMRRLWPIARNMDPAIPDRQEMGSGGAVRMVVAGREAGYLRAKTEELLRLAERALRLAEEAGPDSEFPVATVLYS